MNLLAHQQNRAAKVGLLDSLYQAPAVGRSTDGRAAAGHDAALYGRWVSAPQGTLLNASAVRGVFLARGETVEWLWTHTAAGSFVSGYRLITQKDANLKSQSVISSLMGERGQSKRSKARR